MEPIEKIEQIRNLVDELKVDFADIHTERNAPADAEELVKARWADVDKTISILTLFALVKLGLDFQRMNAVVEA